MKPPVPGLGVATRAATCVRENVEAGLTILPRALALLGQVEVMTGHIELVATRITDLTDAAQPLMTRAAETMADAQGMLDQAGRMVTLYEGPLNDLAPTVNRIAETINPAEVDAIKDLADQLRVLLVEDLMPLVKQARTMGPDMQEILESMEGLGRGLRGLMGINLAPRRTIAIQGPESLNGPVAAVE